MARQHKRLDSFFKRANILKLLIKACHNVDIIARSLRTPPEIRFVEHMLDMVFDVLHHFPAIELLMRQLSEDTVIERDVKQKVKGFLRIWEKGGQQHRTTCLMADLLRILMVLHKEFQRSEITVLDVIPLRDRFLARIKLIENVPYLGAAEEYLMTAVDMENNA